MRLEQDLKSDMQSFKDSLQKQKEAALFKIRNKYKLALQEQEFEITRN